MTKVQLSSVIIFLFGIGCAGAPTVMLSSWKKPDVTKIRFEKTALVAATENAPIRKEAEDELAKLIPRSTPTYSLVSPEQLKNPKAVKEQLRSAGYDGAVVMRSKGMTKETTYVPSSAFDDFQWESYDWDEMGTRVEHVAIEIEILVYSVTDGLLWSGKSKTLDPKSVRRMMPDIVKAAAARMQKDGIVLGAGASATTP